MSAGMIGRVVRGNWHLLGLMVLICGVGTWMAMSPKQDGGVDAVGVDMEIQSNLSAGDPNLQVESRWATPTRDKKTAIAIEQYENELKYNRGNEDTPANLFRLANLYFAEVHDYEKASNYYEALIQEYPDYRALSTAYRNLVVCYERLGKQEVCRSTLHRMMDHFGPESQEYLFAKQELGL